MRIRSAATIALAAGLTASAASQGTTPLQVRYDFTVQVGRNDVIRNGLEDVHPAFVEFTEGLQGTISLLASEVLIFEEPTLKVWQIDALTLQLGSLDIESNPDFYPSANFGTGLTIINDDPSIGDIFQCRPVFADAPFFAPYLALLDPSYIPTNELNLLDSTDLPTSLNLDDPLVESQFDFFTPVPTTAIGTSITGVTITIIPAPATLALLTPAAALVTRRRR
jgi:hypothetical protein